MPKIGAEPMRRAALVDAAIGAIHDQGYCGVTVGAIAKRAGVSTALAHHYFGSKDHLIAETMRHLFRMLGQEVATRLRAAQTPGERLTAIIQGVLGASQFQPELISAWLAFYMQAQTHPEARRLLRIYHRRLRSNLADAMIRADLPPVRARDLAESAASLIDGAWLRYALSDHDTAPDIAAAEVERRVRHLAGIAHSIPPEKTP